MKIFVKVKTRAKRDRVEQIDPLHFLVSVRACPEAGRANRAIETALAEFFNIPVSCVRITKGYSRREKIFEIVM